MAEVMERADRFLRSDMDAFMAAIGIRATGMLTQKLDTPFPPASMPGQSPHKRTGNLQAGISYQTAHAGDEYETAVMSTRTQDDPRVPKWLEFGTKKMAARPYMRPVMNQGERIVMQSAKRSIGSGVPYAALD